MLEVGTKITILESYYQHHELIAKKGLTGVIEEVKPIREYEKGLPKDIDAYRVKFNNGDISHVPAKFVGEYVKRKVERIEDYSNEKLVADFARLNSIEGQTQNMSTKSYAKMLNDIERMSNELLKRLKERQGGAE